MVALTVRRQNGAAGRNVEVQRASALAFSDLDEPEKMVPLPELQSKRCGLFSTPRFQF